MDSERLQLIKEANQYLNKLLNAVKVEVGIIRKNNLNDYKNILAIVEGLQFSLENVLMLTDIANNDLEIKEKAVECLKDLTNAIENQDSVELIDIFEYAIPELINEWKEVYITIIDAKDE